MARRRLNKKIALMGTAVFLLLVLAAVFVILRLNRDPAPFITDGDAAWAAKDYPRARENYERAYGLADAPELKVDLLFKRADVYREMELWDRVLACWEAIVTTDPQNVRAYLGRLKYVYIMADSLGNAGRAMSGYWEEVLSQARKAMEVVTDAGLLEAQRADWEPSFGTALDRGSSRGSPLLGTHLRLVKGRAAVELAGMGAVTSPDELLTEAERDLQEARKLDANNPQVYQYLAQVFVERGDLAASRGDRNEQAAAGKQVDDILAEGVRAAGETVEAHMHLLARKLAVAQQGTIASAREQMQALESPYEELTRRFASSARAFAAQAQFYALFSAYLDSASARGKIDRAIAAANQAAALDRDSAEYVILASGYHYRKSSLYHDASSLQVAMDLADAALAWPDAQDTPGPTQVARRVRRFSLCSLLATCCVERILALPSSDPARADLLARAEKAVHEIEQIHGSGENPEVLKWQGLLDLARGRTDKAAKSLYAAYEQIKAARPPEQRDPFLSYILAQVFKETVETGAIVDFLGTALNCGIHHTKPEAILDYGAALLQAGSGDVVLSAVDSFEERFGPTDRSRALRVKALIGKGLITEAEEAVAKLRPEDPNTIALTLDLIRSKTTQLLAALHQERVAQGADGRNESGAVPAMTAELRGYHRQEADLTGKLLQTDPDAVQERHLVRLCESLIEQGDTSTAGTLVDAFLKRSPDSVSAAFYRGLLSEPDPANCPESRRREIQEQTIRGLADPVHRSLELGLFYQQAGQSDQAAAQWRSVLDATKAQPAQATPMYLKARSIGPRHLAAGYLFDLARRQENWVLAEEIVEMVKRDNLDDCGGYLYSARLAFARKQYETALAHLDECIKQRPVFSYGYVLRGDVKAALGREQESVEDVRQASRLNPMDPVIARTLAGALFQRNSKLGANVSSEQQQEVRQALERAIHLNPRDVNLLSAYADFIGDGDPMKALAIRQTIQTNAPNLRNAIMLGRIASQIAQKETDEQKKAALLRVAQAAFEQARQMDPSDPLLLDSYAAYFRALGQNEKAEQLLAESNDSRLLWRHHFRVRNFEEARRLLLAMYAQPAHRIDALKGLLLIAEETADQAGVKKHSDELISLEDNALNRLAQLRAYLNVGLVSEAEPRLQSLKERFPEEPRTVLLEAQVAKRQGQLSRAMDLVNRSLENDPQNAAIWRLRGEVSLLLGDGDQAVLDFRKSRTLQDDPVTTIALAKAHLWAGRHDEALAELQRAAGQPGAPLEAMTLLEATYLRLGRHEALSQLYARVLAESPDSVFWLNRAGSYALSQGQYERAEELFGKACQLHPPAAGAAPDGQYSLALDGYFRSLILGAGELAAAGGVARPQKLDRLFEEGGKYAETPYAPVAFFRMAEAKKKLGDLTAARDLGRKAMERAWSDERLAVEVMLRVYALLGEPEVSAYCRQRLAEAPDSLAANFVMFTLAQLRDEYDDSISYIDKCIRLSGPDAEAGIEYTIRKADLLSTAFRKTSDKAYLDRAIAVYESLRAKMPKNSSVLNNLAYMLAQNDQRLPEALEFARTAVQHSPDEASFLDTYAYVLYKNGRHAEAAQTLAAAVQQYEARGAASTEVYEHLGMVQEALGQAGKAQAAYRRALDVGGEALPEPVRQRIHLAMERLAGAPAPR